MDTQSLSGSTRIVLSVPGLEALGREFLTAILSCEHTQQTIDHATHTLTRSSDRLAAALKKATK